MIGLTLLIGFLLLRVSNIYGDPAPWGIQDKGFVYSLMSFLSTTKYPPSLVYLLMTLGPVLLLLSLFDNWGITTGVKNRIVNALIIFGQVPLFFYVIQYPLIHITEIIRSYVVYGRGDDWLYESPSLWPVNYHQNLVLVYCVWVLAILVLYPLCCRFREIKRNRKESWISLF